MRTHWSEYGPPVHIAVAAFASGWGMKLTTATPDRAAHPAMSDADAEASFFAEIGALPTQRYVAPRLGLQLTPEP